MPAYVVKWKPKWNGEPETVEVNADNAKPESNGSVAFRTGDGRLIAYYTNVQSIEEKIR